MDASSFYNAWNNAVANTNKADTHERMVVFDDLDIDDFLDDSTDSLPKDDTTLSDNVAQTPVNIDTAKSNDYAITNFIKTSKSVSTEKIAKFPLFDAIQQLSDEFDYEFKNDNVSSLLKGITGQEYSNDKAIKEWLFMFYGIKDNADLNDSILQFSKDELDSICSVNRNMQLSELCMIADYKNDDNFDASIIKKYSLEARDTSLLLELMRNSLLDEEELINYVLDTDVFNSYLTLKVTNKFNKEDFDIINAQSINVDSYTKCLLSSNPWAELGIRSDFNEIYKMVTENDIPYELGITYKDNKWLLQILTAYVKHFYSDKFIERYLNDSNKFAEKMANDYANLNIDLETLNAYDGNYFLAKAVVDVKSFSDKKLALTEDLAIFLEIIVTAIWENNIAEINYKEFLFCVSEGSYHLCKEYNRLFKKKGAVTFNQFWIYRILEEFGIDTTLPDDVGSVIAYQISNGLSYCNVQMIHEVLDKFVNAIKSKNYNLTVKLLPGHSGILICDSLYSEISRERARIQNFCNASCSIESAIKLNAKSNIARYNVIRVINLAQSQSPGAISESFKQLLILRSESYLLFDTVLSIIADTFNEFAGLCMCSEATQCLKIFNNALLQKNRFCIQAEFLKTYLTLKFGNRIKFDRYDPDSVDSISIIEISNSYIYGSVSIFNVLASLDNFTTELNKHSRIICRFNENTVRFEGV